MSFNADQASRDVAERCAPGERLAMVHVVRGKGPCRDSVESTRKGAASATASPSGDARTARFRSQSAACKLVDVMSAHREPYCHLSATSFGQRCAAARGVFAAGAIVPTSD
jgi:hypothetical protein